VTLGEFMPERARPALEHIRDALRSGPRLIRAPAGAAIAAMGAAALPARPDLEEAARQQPELGRYLEAEGPTRLQDAQAEDLRLVAIVSGESEDGAPRAFVLHSQGLLWEAQAGDRLANGEVLEVEEEALAFSAERTDDAFSRVAYRGRLALFERSRPEPVPDGAWTGFRVSVDFEGDVHSFAMLLGMGFGPNLAVEEGTEGPVRIAARQQPWDGIVITGLERGGFEYLIDRNYIRITRKGRLEAVRRLSGEASGHLVNLSFRRGDLQDIAQLFAEVAGRSIDLPSLAERRLVTVHSIGAPWDETFELIVATLGGRVTTEPDRIVVSGLESPRR
jgi:hypothetical protein